MGNSSSSSSHHRGYSTNTGKGVEKEKAPQSSMKALTRKPPPKVQFVPPPPPPPPAEPPPEDPVGTLSYGALASLGFTTFLRDNENAVRRMFDGLRQAAAVEAAERAGTVVGPIPSDVLASQFCAALSELGVELGWSGTALSEVASQWAREARETGKPIPVKPLGQLLPQGGLFRKNGDGAKLISWGEYVQIIRMLEAASAAASGNTSDTLESLRGPRDLVEGLTADLKPPPPMLPEPPIPPPPPTPPSNGAADTLSGTSGTFTAPLSPVSAPPPPSSSSSSSLYDSTSALLNTQIAAAEMALSASQALTGVGGLGSLGSTSASAAGVGGGGASGGMADTAASFFLPDATQSSAAATLGSFAGGSLNGMGGGGGSGIALPPSMYPAPPPSNMGGSGASAVRDFLQSPSRIPVYLPKSLRDGGGDAPSYANPSGSSDSSSSSGGGGVSGLGVTPSARPLTDEDIIAAALRGGGGGEDADDATPSAAWGGGDSTRPPKGSFTTPLDSSTMYKPLSSVLQQYQEALDVVFNYFAFQQRKSGVVAGARDDTFEAYAAKGYSVNKAGLTRCTKVRGVCVCVLWVISTTFCAYLFIICTHISPPPTLPPHHLHTVLGPHRHHGEWPGCAAVKGGPGECVD